MLSPPLRGAFSTNDLSRLLSGGFRLIDISLELDPAKFRMRTYAGFRKDIQFETELIKDYGDGGLGQRVRAFTPPPDNGGAEPEATASGMAVQ